MNKIFYKCQKNYIKLLKKYSYATNLNSTLIDASRRLMDFEKGRRIIKGKNFFLDELLLDEVYFHHKTYILVSEEIYENIDIYLKLICRGLCK